jgi:hypothetical protein
MAAGAALGLAREAGWIYRKGWDLPFLILSAAIVPAPLLFAHAAQRWGGLSEAEAVEWVNILVAGLIGGPHLFSTFTLTLLNPAFLRDHRRFAAGAIAIPGVVIYLGLAHYEILIWFFFAWASVHIQHQIVYFADCYRLRSGARDPLWSRLVDTGVIATGLYPIGLHKLSTGQFRVGEVLLPYPDWLRPLHLPEAVGALFAILVAAWAVKSFREAATGRLCAPKTLLIGVTALISFLLPMGRNLDVLFQGFNAWHSVQYFFLFWLINRLRYERGEVENGFVRRLVSSGRMGPYYLALLAGSLAVMGVTFALPWITPLTGTQSYFVVILSVLLVHYYYDHFLFTRTEYVA